MALRPSVVLRGLVTVLFAPRETVRTFLEAPDERLSFGLVLTGTVAVTLMRERSAAQLESISSFPAPLAAFLVFVAVLFSAVITGILFYLASLLGAWIGKGMGGRASAREVRVALAWGSVPMIWSHLYLIPARIVIWAIGAHDALRAAILGHHEPGQFLATRTVAVVILGLFVAFLVLVTLVWTVVTTSQCLGEAHGFSSGRGFVTLVVSIAMPIFVVLGALMAFVTLASVL